MVLLMVLLTVQLQMLQMRLLEKPLLAYQSLIHVAWESMCLSKNPVALYLAALFPVASCLKQDCGELIGSRHLR